MKILYLQVTRAHLHCIALRLLQCGASVDCGTEERILSAQREIMESFYGK